MVPPAVFVFDNRIEVISYGGLPYGLSLESFYKGLSMPVNPSLVSIFNSAELSEQSGHGVPTIVGSYTEDAFKIESNDVLVTIPFRFVPDFVTFRVNRTSLFDSLTENQKKVYSYLKENSTATLKNVAAELQISLQGVKKIVQKLQANGFLERSGAKRNGIWIVK